MEELVKLNPIEVDMLLKAPVYISLLAANSNSNHGLDETEKKAAIKLTHIKTISSHPTLQGFYKEAEKVFSTNMEQLNNELPYGIIERERAIKRELAKLGPVFAKLENEYSVTLQQSFQSYADYVSRAHRTAVYAIFPIPIGGFNVSDTSLK